jgi:vacuolar protein sorting-associated protein 52
MNLGELEDVLKSFRDSLSQVKNEMTFLQERSVNMNVSLNNRKNLSKTFANFIDNVMLEPTLIDDILKGPINDVYVENIKKLCKKLDYIKKYNLLDNLCVREIEPELSKLKIKACERIRTFIQDEINNLKTPKTNIQLIQQNRLINFKLFMMFLRDQNQPIYFEVVQLYTNTMNKIYVDNFKTYISKSNFSCHSQN